VLPLVRTSLRAALAGALAAACLVVPASVAGAGTDAGETATTAASGQLDLPPASLDELAPLFDPQLKKLGLKTTRASLQDLEEYRQSPTGTHLAWYVEPIDPEGIDDDFYLERIASSAKIFLPKVFKEWSDLEGFDICLEPVEIPSPSPPPISQLQVNRETAKQIRWKRADLADLIGEAAERSKGSVESGDRESFFLYISPRLRDAKQFEQAREDAGLPPATTTSRPTAST
jgi:hypothetical protein